MKKMRKIATLLLALVMILSLAIPAFAADETYSITINNSTSGHIYEAYQIFTGDLDNAANDDSVAGTSAVLSNIEWGSSVTNAASLDSASSVAEKLASGDMTTDDLLAMITLGSKVADSGDTSNPYVISGLEPGYYLVKDEDDSLNGKDDSYTKYIIEVIENSTVSPKSDTPEFQKKVKDTNDTTGTTTDWQDSADYDIGDDVPFQLKATLANNVADYSSYKVVFHDTLSAGLTFDADSVKVYVDGKLVESGYTVVTNPTDGCTFEVVITDAKDLGAGNSSVITVEYTAELNSSAVLGSTGNPNVANLEYSNNPNWKPEGNEDEDDSPTGETPEDKVIVFTYKVVVNKVDKDGNALAGAGFTLYKKNASGEYVAIGEELKGNALTTFEWTHLDDGDYKLVETTTPAGYNTIDDIEFTITAEHDVLSDSPALTKLEGGDLFTGEVSTGALTADIVNQSGATLPETGGIGTTIFYVLGAVMVLGAAVLLVTKKRMAA